MAHPDDLADQAFEEAMHRRGNAMEAVEEMGEFLRDPDDDGYYNETEAERLAGEFLSAVKASNDEEARGRRLREESADR